MSLSPQQKLDIRKNIQQALSFLQSMEQEAESDQFDQIPNLLTRMEGALFDLRQALSMQSLNATAAIMDEYEEEP